MPARPRRETKEEDVIDVDEELAELANEEESAKERRAPTTIGPARRCPKCQSRDILVERKKWSGRHWGETLAAGLIFAPLAAASAYKPHLRSTCKHCGHEWVTQVGVAKQIADDELRRAKEYGKKRSHR